MRQRSSSTSESEIKSEHKDKGKAIEEQQYAADLAIAAREQRAAARRIRAIHGGPVAFEVRLDDDGTEVSPDIPQLGVDHHDPKPHARAPSDSVEQKSGASRRNSAAEEYARGLKVITDALASRSRESSREGGAMDLNNNGNERRRRSWGAPVDVEDIRRTNQSVEVNRNSDVDISLGDAYITCKNLAHNAYLKMTRKGKMQRTLWTCSEAIIRGCKRMLMRRMHGKGLER